MASEKDEKRLRRRRRRRRFLLVLAALFTVAAVAFSWDFFVRKNFDTVVPGRLYRSGQPSRSQLDRWIREYELKTILVIKPTLRDYGPELAAEHGIEIHHIPLSTRREPTEEEWQSIKALLTDEEKLPLLYHCHSGSDKTGLVTALYRVEVQGWPVWKALLEMDLHYHLPPQYPVLQCYVRERFAGAEASGDPDPGG